nr:hypothetical protein [Tanacetum cinerariifolium]
MLEEDEEMTAFHTDRGVFFHTHMPKGLKRFRATYQRLMTWCLQSKGKGMWKPTWKRLLPTVKPSKISFGMSKRPYIQNVNMKLNPNECIFRMEEGRFLGWTERAEKALQKVKKKMGNLPTLVFLKEDETLMSPAANGRNLLHASRKSGVNTSPHNEVEGSREAKGEKVKKYQEEFMNATAPFCRFESLTFLRL